MNWNQLVNFATLDDELGRKFPYHKNPTKENLSSMLDYANRKYPYFPHLRGVLDHKTGDAHVWPGEAMEHNQFVKAVGLGLGQDHIHLIQKTNSNSMRDVMPAHENQLAITPSTGFNQKEVESRIANHPWMKSMGLNDKIIQLKGNRADSMLAAFK
jgi:hypothetical protein